MSDNKNGEIVLCKMFSGNYWEDENNIGYESINMFLPDGQKQEQIPVSYMYLPANGDYDIKNIDIKNDDNLSKYAKWAVNLVDKLQA